MFLVIEDWKRKWQLSEQGVQKEKSYDVLLKDRLKHKWSHPHYNAQRRLHGITAI